MFQEKTTYSGCVNDNFSNLWHTLVQVGREIICIAFSFIILIFIHSSGNYCLSWCSLSRAQRALYRGTDTFGMNLAPSLIGSYCTNSMEQRPSTAHVIKNSPPFMEPEAISCSQEPATGSYPEPHESSPHPISEIIDVFWGNSSLFKVDLNSVLNDKMETLGASKILIQIQLFLITYCSREITRNWAVEMNMSQSKTHLKYAKVTRIILNNVEN
jgi:hypothetical protein